jgi:hypothetical protein
LLGYSNQPKRLFGLDINERVQLLGPRLILQAPFRFLWFVCDPPNRQFKRNPVSRVSLKSTAIPVKRQKFPHMP